VLHKQLSCTSQACVARSAKKKVNAQVFFQLFERSRKGELLDMKSLGRTCEVKLFRDRHKTSWMPEFQGVIE
jgi:hypothetical protein